MEVSNNIEDKKPTPFLKRIANLENEIKRLEKRLEVLARAIKK